MSLQLAQTGALIALAAVLTTAARAKLGERRRRGRPLAGGELVLAVALLVGPPAPAAAVAAVVFVGFSAVHVRTWRADADCGCFGEGGPASGPRTVALTLLGAGAGAAAAAGHPQSPAALAAARPLAALAVAAAAIAAALVWRSAFATTSSRLTGASERLVAGSALFLERRISRRSALARLATVGSALAVAPLRYLLYPVSALAAILPGDCASGLCTDGYTVFCCEINRGLNACPAGTFAGGWWKCTDYRGRQLCREEGVRYYVDCNRIPGTSFPGGCRCADDSCANRRVACNVFRYGQCNPQVHGVTEVVCRMVLCENPSRVPSLNCSASLAVDDAVCGQEAPCLEPPAVYAGPAGGV